MDRSVFVFVVLLMLSLPGIFPLKMCSYRDFSIIGAVVDSRVMRWLNLGCGWPLVLGSIAGILQAGYLLFLLFQAGQLDDVANIGWVLILIYPVVGIWLGRRMICYGRHGCDAV